LTQRIYLLTGPVRSGKTTALRKWAHRQTKVCGLLTPDLDGFRCFMDLQTQHYFLMEAVASPASQVLEIGRFQFNANSFSRARRILQHAKPGVNGTSLDCEWIIVDEVGPMELRGDGLEPEISRLIEEHKTEGNTRLVLVVRDSILEQVIDHFKIDYYHLLTKGTLSESLVT